MRFKAGKRVQAKGVRSMVWGIYFEFHTVPPLHTHTLQYVLQHYHRFWRHLASASADNVGI